MAASIFTSRGRNQQNFSTWALNTSSWLLPYKIQVFTITLNCHRHLNRGNRLAKKKHFACFNTTSRNPLWGLWFAHYIKMLQSLFQWLCTPREIILRPAKYAFRKLSLGTLKGRVCRLKFRYILKNLSLLTDKLFTNKEFLSHGQNFNYIHYAFFLAFTC